MHVSRYLDVQLEHIVPRGVAIALNNDGVSGTSVNSKTGVRRRLGTCELANTIRKCQFYIVQSALTAKFCRH